MPTRYLWVGVICLTVGWAPAFAATIVVDGNPHEWGINVADNNGTTFNVPVGLNLLGSFFEDQDDSAGDGGELGPNRGGQNYDAELLAIVHQDGKLYITIVTGQRPDNGFARYAPGDIRIETDLGTYGIEVGGGAGSGAGTAIGSGDAGATYTLNSHGFTVGHAEADPAQTAGSIWADVDWLLDPIAPQEPTQFEINASSTPVGVADYHYTRDTLTTQHAVIELSFEASWFAGQTIEWVRWEPACGNDRLDVEINFVPEPASLALLAVGGLVAVRRRRR